MIRILLIVMALCVTGASSYAIGSAPCSSILDVDQLTSEEKDKLRAEIEQFQAQRLLNGAAVCIQIDFMEQLPPVRQGFTEDGRKIIHRSVYDEWQTRHFSQPAVLLLFVKGPGRYVLHDLVLSRPVVRHLPDLVRRYIRDEIIKKQPDSYEAVSAGVYALSQALNSEYKERLVTGAATLVPQKKYHKGYAYDAFDYYYFKLIQTDADQDLGCQELLYSTHFDPVYYEEAPLDYNVPPEKEHTIKIPATVFDFYRNDKLVCRNRVQEVVGATAPTLVALSTEDEASLYSASRISLPKLGYHYEYFDFSSPDTEYTSPTDPGLPEALRERLNTIDQNFRQFRDWRFNRNVSPQSPMLFERYRRKCHARVKVYSGRKQSGDPITMHEGLALSWNERFGNAQRTYCDAFASDLSQLIFGKKLFGRSTSTIEPLMTTSDDFWEIKIDWTDRAASFTDVWDYVDKGFVVYFVHKGDHIETCYPKVGGQYMTVGAGTITDFKKTDSNFMWNRRWNEEKGKYLPRGVRCFVYFGHLKK